MAESPATFKAKTIQSALHLYFKDDKTKVNKDALALVAELLRVFTSEAAERSAVQAQTDAKPQALESGNGGDLLIGGTRSQEGVYLYTEERRVQACDGGTYGKDFTAVVARHVMIDVHG